MLIYKYAVNLYLIAVSVNPALTPPRLGAPDNENWVKAWQYLNAIS